MRVTTTREEKAARRYEAGIRPIELDAHSWLVAGTRPYQVKETGGSFECECPDFCYRQAQCKHIIEVQMLIGQHESALTKHEKTLSNGQIVVYC